MHFLVNFLYGNKKFSPHTNIRRHKHTHPNELAVEMEMDVLVYGES